MRCVVIGLGGTGSCLVPPLARMLNFGYNGSALLLVDGDQFERKNIDRQLAENGGNKAESIENLLTKQFDRILISSRDTYVDEYNISRIIQENDIVFSCVDNHKTRKLISDYTSNLDNILTISGGNFLTDGIVQAHLRRNSHDLTLPIANDHHPEIQNPQDKHPDELSCSERMQSEPQLLVMNFSIASKMLEVFYAYLTNSRIPDETYVDITTFASRAYFRSNKQLTPTSERS